LFFLSPYFICARTFLHDAFPFFCGVHASCIGLLGISEANWNIQLVFHEFVSRRLVWNSAGIRLNSVREMVLVPTAYNLESIV